MKSIKFIIVTIICIICALTAVGCSSEVNKLYFIDTELSIYLDEAYTIMPNVATRPEGADYTLTSSNPTIVKVNDDKKTVTGIRKGIATLTATAGELTATINVLVYESRESSNIPTENDGKIVVYFHTEYGSFYDQRVTPGELAVKPEAILRPGYTLFGWYKDAEFREAFDFSTPITESINLYALWALDEPSYAIENVDGVYTVTGFEHTYIPYENITLPASDGKGNPVTAIAEAAFSENQSLKTVVIPSSYTEIPSFAFSECPELTSVTIQGDIVSIGRNAFESCGKLESVSIQSQVIKSIGDSAFDSCTSLKTINLPDSIDTIGQKAFYECDKLTTITLPASLKLLQMQTFAGSGLTAIDLRNVEQMNNQVFWDCDELATVTGAENLDYVGSYVFGSLLETQQAYATKWLVNNIELGSAKDQLVTLGNVAIYAFARSLKPEFTVKGNITHIASQCFADASGAIVRFSGTTPPSRGNYCFGGNDTSGPVVDIVVPYNYYETYLEAWLTFGNPEENNGYKPLTSYAQAITERLHYAYNANTDSALEIFINKPVTYSQLTETLTYSTNCNVIINLYDGVQETVDVKSAIENYVNDAGYTSYVVTKLKSFAFNTDNPSKNLVTLILPNNIKLIEDKAITNLTKCTAICIIGDDSWSPRDTVASKQSINMSLMPVGSKIYVNDNLLTQYRTAWANYPAMRDYLKAYSTKP